VNAQHDSLRNWFNNLEWFKNAGNEAPAGKVVNSSLMPHSSANIEDFAKQYKANPSRWNKAFAYLRNTDFSKLPAGKYPIDGDDVFALITIVPPKPLDSARWEAHRKYNDIHLVIDGKEKIGIAPVAGAKPIVDYNSDRDIGFYTAEGTFFLADQKTFFIVTTNEAHAPGIKADGNEMIKKLVIKVRRN
jgi:YhcH/YjgK/YiaL family protein